MALSEPRWHPEVILDAEFARNWYADRSPFAARGFLLALEASVRSVSQAPQRWPVRNHGCRHYVLPSRYPYTLIYRLEPEFKSVAVAHQRQTPGYWTHQITGNRCRVKVSK